MNKHTLLLLSFLFLGLVAKAKTVTPAKAKGESRITHHVVAGLNVGAVTPVSLPDNVREIKNYNPLLNPSIGYEGRYSFNKRWSFGVQLKVDLKGMFVQDQVMYFHTMVTMENGGQSSSFEGDFSGINTTTAQNVYLTLPLYVVYKPYKKWEFRLGGYVARLLKAKFEGNVSDGYIRRNNSLGEKVLVNSANFDFADKECRFDWGLYAGTAHDIGKRWQVNLNMEWGLQRMFPASFPGISFPMYNIYGNLGCTYRL